MSEVADREPIACIGHSHVKSVADAAERRGVPFLAINFWKHKDPVVTRDGRRQWCDGIEAQLGRGPVFSMIGGSSHHVLGLLMHPHRRPFDFVLPSAPDLPIDGGEVIPFDVVKAALSELLDQYLRLMTVLIESRPEQVVHIEPPPVYADADRMTPDLRALPIFKKGGVISPRYLRYKLWRLQSELLIEFCNRHRVPFVPHPASAVDADGFLLSPYYLNPMHANELYGDLVLTQMQDCIRDRYVAAT